MGIRKASCVATGLTNEALIDIVRDIQDALLWDFHVPVDVTNLDLVNVLAIQAHRL